MSGIAQMGIVVLYVFGMALVVVEVFLPGVILGLFGLACVVGAIWLAFATGYTPLGIVLVGLTVLSIPVIVWMWLRVINRVLVMKTTEKDATGAAVEHKTLVGQEGVALTQLRPAGVARFGDTKVDVVSEGPVIERDARVKVIEVRGNRVVVREVRR